MVKVIQKNKVVILLNGRYAGKKAVVVETSEGDAERKHGYAVVAGIARYPLKVKRGMGKKKIAKRSKVKPFVKIVNHGHILPTRYKFEGSELKGAVKKDTVVDPAQRSTVRKEVKKIFESRYKSGENKWFFEKLRF